MNPYALYVKCDGAMNYDSNNSGGIGFEVIFPDSDETEIIKVSQGKYIGANIERLELEALISGLEYIIKLYQNERNKFSNINTIKFVTDRYRLNDQEGTNAFRIKDWRKNNWCNFEGKEIKNYDLLDKLDKQRKKLSTIAKSRVDIIYKPRKQNKSADKLAKMGKDFPIIDDSIAIKGTKIGQRKFQGCDINYKLLKIKQEIHIHIYLKTPCKNTMGNIF